MFKFWSNADRAHGHYRNLSAIIGFDDQPIAEVLYPGLTTIRQPIQELGEYVATVMIAHIEHKSLPEKPELKTKLIIRGTA